MIALDHLDLIEKLPFLFSAVLVPKAVRRELFKRRVTKKRLRILFRSYAFLQRCNSYDEGVVDVLLTGKMEGIRDRGEAEAVAQASYLGTAVIVDDPWGRELARLHGLEFHGTVWILRRFYELGLLTAGTVRDSFSLLRERGVRLPWDVVSEFLRGVEEPGR